MIRNQISKFYFDHPGIWYGIGKILDRFERETKFLVDIFNEYKVQGSILDVGSGTGSHLNKLSKKGFVCTGVDLNKNMVNYAKRKYPKLTFELGDMKNLNYINKFDAIICLCTTFCYNLTNEDISLSLKSFHKALKSNGVLIIEMMNPISFIEKRGFPRKFEDKKFEKIGIKFITENKINEHNQFMIEKREIYDFKKNKKLKTDVTKIRLFFPQEVRYFLENNGFTLMEFYGDYNKKSKKLDKSKLIVISKKI